VAAADHIDAYAQALVQIAQGEGDLPRVQDELFVVADRIRSNDLLRDSLTDQRIPIELRQAIVEDLLGGKAGPTTTSLVSMIVGAGRARDLPAIIEKVVEKAAEAQGATVARVISAYPLDGERQQRLSEALARRFHHPVSVKVIIDPSIIGGVIVQVGDTVIDGSIRTRLDQLKSSF
jgi:F-type H+-transporting ATPase subunit delta